MGVFVGVNTCVNFGEKVTKGVSVKEKEEKREEESSRERKGEKDEGEKGVCCQCVFKFSFHSLTPLSIAGPSEAVGEAMENERERPRYGGDAEQV